MKRQFTGLRKQRIGFGNPFTCRKRIYTPTTLVKSVPLNQVLFLKVDLKWFQNSTFRINYLENFYSFFAIIILIFLCEKIHENFYRSVALNILNTIKTFNTTNRTSRFSTGDYSDIIGIHLRKFTRIIRKRYSKFILSKFIFSIFIKHFLR